MKTKFVFLLSVLLCLGLASRAQAPLPATGGVKGTIVDRSSRQPIEKATVSLMDGTRELGTVTTAADGTFQFSDLPNGVYTLVVSVPDYLTNNVPATVADGYVKNLFNLSMTSLQRVAEVDDDSFANLDMDDSGYHDNPTILFGSNDVFNNIAGYNFSAVRFRARGFLSESQDVYLAGVKMNDAVTGYTPYSLWSGLNEAMRSKETVNGTEAADFSLGGYNGATNIFGNASSVRKGLRGSLLTNSALYRLRVMASYASGMLDNGWSYAANVSVRLGGNDWVDGVYYRSFAYYLAADKKIDEANKLGFVFFGTPGQRGAQNGSTQEVYDLMGDNMYNSNWGYQNGVVRNARVRKTHEPVAIFKYDYTPSDEFELHATLLGRFGKNGYTALDWYNAQSPSPDYYRNLPSYFYNADADYNRNNRQKAMYAYMSWYYEDEDVVHLNWDRLYQVNRASTTGRSSYVQEERRVDQRDFNFATQTKYRPNDWTVVTGGVEAKVNRTEYYKKVADLLGGKYYVNVDTFADRDFASTPYMTQNDLDYYLEHGAARTLGVGDKYGYDYLARIRNVSAWANGEFSLGNLSANVGGRVGYNSFWRYGLVRKGLFPGQPSSAAEAARWAAEGITPTDETSYGKSDVARFLTWAGKLGVRYVIGGCQQVYANAGIFHDAPHFNQVFLSPRTRNTMVSDLEAVKTLSAEAGWQFNRSGINARVTGFYATIKDQSKVMSAYDDLQNAFSNFALSGIDERHMGVEVGFKVPTYLVDNLSVQGVVSYGRYEYTSTPTMIQTLDNTAEEVSFNGQTEIPVRYWKEHPVYKRYADGTYSTQVDRYEKHYVPSTPQFAASLGLSYNYKYWFIDADVEYFDKAYLDMNPLYRTDYATQGPEGKATPEEVESMAAQEKFDPSLLVNLSVGKSWFIHYKYQLGFSLNARNLLNNRDVRTGGYEQTRMVDNTVSKSRYYRFDPKYFYMSGMNYMLNIYFRF